MMQNQMAGDMMQQQQQMPAFKNQFQQPGMQIPQQYLQNQ